MRSSILKIFALMLALLMLVGMVSCAQTGDESDTDSNSESELVSESVSAESSSDSETGWETDSNGYIKDGHEGIDLNQREIRIMCGNSFDKEGTPAGSVEFHVDAASIGTPVKAATYLRNMTVQKRLNCKLKWIDVACSYETYGEFSASAEQLSGNNGVDLIGVYSLTSSSMMVKGLLADLNQSETLELEKPWWNSRMIDSCSIQNRMYFCSGDISYGVLGGAYVFMYNKELYNNSGLPAYVKETYGYDSIYDLVNNDEWTLDVMMDLAKLATVNEDKIKDDSDIFGYTSYAVGTDAFYLGSGLKICEKDPYGALIISEDMYSTKANNLCNKLVQFFSTTGAVVPDAAGYNKVDGLPERAWFGGKALFFNHFMSSLNDERLNFEKGVLPVPMYDTNQEAYLTTCTFGASMWSVVRGAQGYEDLCTVLDTIASEGYRQVTPAYFDTVLAGRQDSKNDHDMLYMIREGIVIDGGRVITDPFDEETIKIWRRAIRGTKEYTTEFSEKETVLFQQASALNTLIATMEDLYS